jgi:Pyruvate/2-oxoacid:ferredoxin oxidoreductase delta subunit
MTPVLEINERCISCDACRIICPEDAVLKYKDNYAIETWSCTLCSICIEVCPVDCIKLIEEEAS